MTETKTCQSCKHEFTIEPEDFEFYAKIKVPPPTWCPECRLKRRLTWNNTTSLYRRLTTDTGKEVISMYSADKPHKVMEDKKWWSDEWDALEYGRDYDFSKPFFSQFKQFIREVPLPHLQREYSTMINSEYCNAAAGLKNCYLVTNADDLEDCAYGEMVQRSKDCEDIIFTYDSELCYEGTNLQNCYKTLFSQDCENCRDIWFCLDCFDCSDCFGCVNLRKKSYHIFNKPCSKEEYRRELEKLQLHTRSGIGEAHKTTKESFRMFPRRFMHGRLNANVSGEYVYQSKNAKGVYDCHRVENCKHCHFMKYMTAGTSDSYDYTTFGITADRIYDTVWCGIQVSNLKFCFWNYNAQNLTYCIGCHNSQDLFSCIGLRKKQYCILNKQYTRGEYEALVSKIIAHTNQVPYIDEKGRVYRYGEFFPPEISPFAYNETWAHSYFPLTKEEVLNEGFAWKEPEKRNYEITIQPDDLPETIGETQDDITREIIGCTHEGRCNENCTTAFRVIAEELQLHRRLNIPIPTLCPNCRRHEKLKKRNHIKLFKRKCQCRGVKSDNGAYENTTTHFHKDSPCPNTFETSYAPERPEIVYCESCYNAEVV